MAVAVLVIGLAALCVITATQEVPLLSNLNKPQRRLHSNASTAFVDCAFQSVGENSLYYAMDLQPGLDCINQVKVAYAAAILHVTSLADVFQEFYVYVDIAKDPLASPQSIPFNFSVFPEKIDLVGGLRELARSWHKNQSLGLVDVVLPVNELFNRLRDAHVWSTGIGRDGSPGAEFGNVLQQFKVALRDTHTNDLVWTLEVSPSAKGKPTGTVSYSTYSIGANATNATVHEVRSIDGKPFLSWLTTTFATNPAFPLPYKSVGSRINRLLDAFASGASFSLSRLGNISSVANKTYKVKFTDGSISEWKWVLATWNANITSELPQVVKVINTPGPPYQALVKAYEQYMKLSNPMPTPTSSRRRQLLDSNVHSICCNSNGDPVGEYWVQPGEYAVWKLESFDFYPEVYVEAWRHLVNMSKEGGVTNLLLDVTSNGGGIVQTAWYGDKALYPGIAPNKVDSILGPAAQYLIANGLDIYEQNQSTMSFVSNSTWVDMHIAALNNNRTAIQNLVKESFDILQFMSTVFNESSRNQFLQGCGFDLLDCRVVWNYMDQATTEIREDVLAIASNGSALTVPMFKDIVKILLESLRLVTPFGPAGYDPLQALVTSDGLPGLTPMAPVYHVRGGINGTYTPTWEPTNDARYQSFLALRAKEFGINASGLDPKNVLWDAGVPGFEAPIHPFKKIIAVGNGMCGSSCDQFTRTAWLYSLTHPEAATFRFVTFGGTGKKEDISPTEFGAGNVINNDYVTQGLAYFALSSILALWTGQDKLEALLVQSWEKMPLYPFGNTLTPTYSQTEIYQHELGPNSLPWEYYLVPTDYYIKKWYTNTFLSGSGLPQLYSDAAKFFDKLPAPKPQPRSKSRKSRGSVAPKTTRRSLRDRNF